MTKNLSAFLLACLLIFSSTLNAKTGKFFQVDSSGQPANLSFILCLNIEGPLSCQIYEGSGSTLNISTTIPNHSYPRAGIKILTAGYSVEGCRPNYYGYCPFGVSSGSPAIINLVQNTSKTATLGGSVSGLISGNSLVLQNNGESLTVLADGTFTFPTPIKVGSPYTVTVQTQPPSQICSIVNSTGIMRETSVTNVTVTCVDTYTVGGNVSGLAGGTLVLQNVSGTISETKSISTDGNFVFPTAFLNDSPYLVTVTTQPQFQTCTVTNGSGTINGANVSVTVTCSTNTYTVGGDVQGLAVGESVTLGNNSQTISVNYTTPPPITFDFPAAADGSAYNVVVLTSPPTKTCTVANGSGTLNGANVTNVQVTCSINSYFVGGQVNGLALGEQVSLNNNGEVINVAYVNPPPSPFQFPTKVAEGSMYNVTVSTPPLNKSCSVLNGNDTMGSGNVTDVVVNCVPDMTTLTVASTGIIPVGGGSGLLTVTNAGAYTARNVHVVLPSGWTQVVQTPCTTIPVGGSCDLSFSTTLPYVAQGNLSVTGDNITNPPTTALATTLSGYLVFAIDSSSVARVVDTVNISDSQEWADQASPTNGQLLTDGYQNTLRMVANLPVPNAGSSCADSTAGGVPINTWYLPAICEMTDSLMDCVGQGYPNLSTNLGQLGFGNFNSGDYWSSTEVSIPNAYAGNLLTNQTSSVIKVGTLLAIRCVRTITY